jgi:hypothetical protein
LTKSGFTVKFQPAAGQAYQGALAVDQRSFVLTGQGLNPPLPGASILFGSSVGQSAQQNNVSIPLASASQISGTGTLTMTFQPGVQGISDDPAVQFLSGPPREASITISPGDTYAKFDGGQQDLAFQTGTTAGTITSRPAHSVTRSPAATLTSASCASIGNSARARASASFIPTASNIRRPTASAPTNSSAKPASTAWADSILTSRSTRTGS